MTPTDLAFCTCDELIAELLSRTTFFGCVVHSAEEHRGENWKQRTFRVRFNDNLDPVRTGRLLDTVAEQLQGQTE
jgi:hypothetical protein